MIFAEARRLKAPRFRILAGRKVGSGKKLLNAKADLMADSFGGFV
jgi:hypothetical protein